ncbi:MAG: hypothetical protein EHM57_00130 [Actinobacteria bacterium]|nr:MAG: hypothetical protein EHM57_00130 [Actinomycetota bacterium]
MASGEASMNDDTRVLAPGFAPTPFTAAEIRRGCPVGREIRTRIESAGGDPFVSVTRYVGGDAATAVQETKRLRLDGTPIDEAARQEVPRHDLQAHASFPADRTEIAEEAIETPMGTMDCVRYTVGEGDDGTTFWFAKALPGMPVRVASRHGGRVTPIMTMIASTMPG